MPADTCKLGMIGCGLIAQAHGIAANKTTRDVVFSACSSKSVDSAKAFAAEFGCAAVHQDHNALLANDDLQGVVIASPPDTHYRIIRDCIRAGIRFVLCEKPLTANADEARAMQIEAEGAGVTILEGFMYRHHPQIAVLTELLQSGELGTVDQIQCSVNMLDASETNGVALPANWRRNSGVGGVMHDFLCYPIDIANLFMAAQPTRALARVFESPTYGTPYRVFAMIEYEDGAIASISASRKSDFSQPLFVGCEKGSIRLATTFNPVGDTEIVVHNSEGLIGQRRRAITVPVPEPVSERLIDLHVFTTQLEHFCDLIDSVAVPAVGMEQSVRNAQVRDALIESGKSNTWQSIA